MTAPDPPSGLLETLLRNRGHPDMNQSTHSSVANSTASKDCHGPRRGMTSALNRPLMVSARALRLR